jgi:RNA polymerase sigma-70 factor (ECF subfamily)
MGPSDAELVARVIERDDRHAFATLVRRHQAMVRSLLRRLTCGDAALADDLAQETFLTAYRALAHYRAEGKLSSWLYRIAYNGYIDAVRARRRHPAGADEAGELGAVTGEAERVEARHDLERAMVVLRPAERAALALTYGADATHEEAAVILDCPVGTVKSYVLAAKQKLRVALQAEPAVAPARGTA